MGQDHTNLSQSLETANRLQVVHAVALGLAVCASLSDGALAASTAHTHAVDDKT